MLKPGGLLIATYMGRWNAEYAGGEPWNEDEIGMSIVQQHLGWEAGGPSVLMSDWWVRAHWGRAFEILEIAPQVHGQSWALMRKRDVALTTEDLRSLSWRVTVPLRCAKSAVRERRDRSLLFTDDLSQHPADSPLPSLRRSALCRKCCA